MPADDGLVPVLVDDAGQAGDTSFQLIALRPGGKLLAEALRADGNSGQEQGTLWESDDTGAHWSASVSLPGNAPQVSVSSDPQATDHGGWGYLYVTFLSEGTGGGHQSLAYGTITTSGTLWTPLPLPMADNTFPGRPMGSLVPDGSEGPLESMLYLLPESSSARALAPLYMPWVWDTARGEWLLDSVYLPADTLPQGSAWNNGTLSIVFSVVHQGIIPSTVTFISTITPNGMRNPG